MHSTLLAFDIGTSGLKASLVDENLNIIRNVTTSYPTHHYPNGGCEQEAADWWMSAVRAMMMLREFAPEYVKRVDAIGVSGHMLGCLPMDKDGQTLSAKGNKILMSVGRRAVTAGLGLENLGIEMNRGAVKVDDKMRTNAPNVFAAGDITGFSMLAHTASREGEVVVNNLTGRADRMRYNAIPGVVYTNPEVAGVGLTEEQAKAEGIEYKIAKLPMAYAGRFVAENEGGAGLCKVIVGAKYGEVLGVHMLGNPCSEIIYGACMAIEQEMTLKEMQEVVFPHPTVSEIFKETVFSFNE